MHSVISSKSGPSDKRDQSIVRLALEKRCSGPSLIAGAEYTSRAKVERWGNILLWDSLDQNLATSKRNASSFFSLSSFIRLDSLSAGCFSQILNSSSSFNTSEVNLERI